MEAARPEVYNFRFSAGKEFREKLERLGEVLGIANAARRMPEVLERAIDLALEKKDPKAKLERRRRREEAAARRETSSRSGRTETDVAPPASSSPPPEEELITGEKRERSSAERRGSRYIPSSVRDRLLERTGYRCEYTGPEGVRCQARTRLEVDHIRPVGRDGGRDEGNLRILCRGHNLLAAEREFGAGFMRRRIERAKIEGRTDVQRILARKEFLMVSSTG